MKRKRKKTRRNHSERMKRRRKKTRRNPLLRSGLKERGLGFGSRKCLVDVAENDAGIKRGVDGRVNALLGVIIHQWRRLSVVRVQSFLESFRVVIRPAHQWFTSEIIDHGNFGWVELFVVRPSGGDVEESSGNAAHEKRVVDGELDDAVQRRLPLVQQVVKLLRLHDRTRKPVQQESVATFGFVQVVADEVDDQIVAD